VGYDSVKFLYGYLSAGDVGHPVVPQDKQELSSRYDSFLVRRWLLPDGRWRIEVEHLQGGYSTRVASMLEAMTWIEERPIHKEPGVVGDRTRKSRTP
jgi:hypothetical protein